MAGDKIYLGGRPKTVIEIWSALAVNQIGPKMNYEQAKEVLEKAHFDNVLELYSFLMYNKSNSGYQTSIWTPNKITKGDSYSNKELSLKNCREFAEDFWYEQRKEMRKVTILTYPQAYDDVESMVKETLRPNVDPRYNPGPHPRKGEFEDIIRKIVPTLKTTETEMRKERLMRLIGRQNQYKNDGMKFR